MLYCILREFIALTKYVFLDYHFAKKKETLVGFIANLSILTVQNKKTYFVNKREYFGQQMSISIS